MADNDTTTTVPDTSGQAGTTQVKTALPGTTGTDGGTAPLQTSEVPVEFQGKNLAEVVKSYQELQKKLGEQSEEVHEAREAKKNVETLLGAVYSKPENYNLAKGWISDYLGVPQDKTPLQGSEEAKPASSPEQDDTRRAVQTQIIEGFYQRYGINRLPEAERKEVIGKIANQFADFVDPGGNKPVSKLLADIPLDRLPRMLENSYKLVNTDKLREQGKLEGLLAQAENREASIGTIHGGGSQQRSVELSADEREVAGNLGIPIEKYKKRKEEILEYRNPST